MSNDLDLDLEADDQKLLGQVLRYYQDILKQSPEALDYLRRKGITNSQIIDHFRVGFADRSLGLKLPSQNTKAGRELRGRLQKLGLFRDSGHEHFAGSVLFPILAADGCGQIVDVYGCKVQGKRLRKGTPLQLHLNDDGKGAWNVEAFGAVEELIICGSLFDALTLWNHGYRNVTCTFDADKLSDDLLSALKEFCIQRVLTTCQGLTDKFMEAGMETFLVKLPPEMNINEYAKQVNDPADALGSLLRSAEWVGKGKAPSAPQVPQTCAEEETSPREEEAEEPPPERTASPLPSAPEEDEATVSDDEVKMEFGNRRYRIRGLSKNQSYDVLRVNVLVSNDHGLHVDTFDLYGARHRKIYQQQAATELAVEEQTVKKDLGKVLLKLEQLQEAQMQKALAPKETIPEITAGEKEAALRLLRDPSLLDRITDDFSLVGERTNKLVGYLAAVSRKLNQPLAVIVQSTSAAGKSTLMEAILAFVPSEDVVKYSAMTGQSLYYIGESSLKHKILAIAEEEGAERASYALKLLQSEGELRIASTGKEISTGRLVTQEYKVEGPTMIFLTTTNVDVDEELLNRCLVLTVDEDREQTRLIHQLQRQQQTLQGLLQAKTHQETLTLHRNAQRLLRPLLVANPFAEDLTFLDNKTRTRRDHLKYLTLIRTITLLHQYQRPVRTIEHQGKEVQYVEVTLEDIEIANQLASEVLGRSLDDLSPQTRRLLHLIDQMATEACREQGLDRADYRFSRRDVREHTHWSDTALKVHLRRLVTTEYLLAHREEQSKRLQYELLYEAQETEGQKVLAQLVDVARLRCHRSGQHEDRSGGGQPSVSPRSGGGQGEEIDATSEPASTNAE